MTYMRKNKGTCSSRTTVRLSREGLIESIQVDDGCDGNLKGLCAMLVGQPAREVIGRLSAIRCEEKATSCPHQIALCLQEALAQKG